MYPYSDNGACFGCGSHLFLNSYSHIFMGLYKNGKKRYKRINGKKGQPKKRAYCSLHVMCSCKGLSSCEVKKLVQL